jgi:predicted ATPase
VRIATRTLLVIPPVCLLLVCTFVAPTRAGFASMIPASDEEIVDPSAEVPTDLYGNEVREAVARYKVDPTGVLYEEHSPETEVPRLAPPKS